MPENTPQKKPPAKKSAPKSNNGNLVFLIILIVIGSLYLGMGAHQHLKNQLLIDKISDTSSAEFKDKDSVWLNGVPYKNDYARAAVTDAMKIRHLFPWTVDLNETYSKGIIYGTLGIFGAIIFIIFNLLFRGKEYTMSEVILIILLGGLMACFFVLLLFSALSKGIPAIAASAYPQYAASIFCGLCSDKVYKLIT